jgi:EamA domain-containing membrane protein RarD
MSKEMMATLTFAGYALGMAFRDIAVGDTALSKEMTEDANHYVWIVFTTCATILLLSFAYVLMKRQRGLVKKLKVPGAMHRAVTLGVLCSGIYLGIIYVLVNLGAGLSGLLDYGVGPFAMMAVGWGMFKEKPTAYFVAAFLVCVIGTAVLLYAVGDFTAFLAGIAVLIPVASALSDGYVKWLVDENRAGLTSAQLLIVRFLPATLVLYALAAVKSGTLMPQMDQPLLTVAVAAAFAWAPLMLLCTALGVAGMQRLAMWEFMIPVITFFGTLHLRPQNVGFLPVLGAVLILSGVVIYHTLKGRKEGVAKQRRRARRGSPRAASNQVVASRAQG